MNPSSELYIKHTYNFKFEINRKKSSKENGVLRLIFENDCIKLQTEMSI